jgi:serine/threonine-protein kinase
MAFSVVQEGLTYAFSQSADGSGQPEPLRPDQPTRGFAASFTPDGRVITWGVGDGFGLLELNSREPLRYLWKASALERNPVVSPDGRWLAFESNRTGRFEIYVRSFPSVNEEWTMTSEGACCPVWARDGRELHYWRDNGDGTVSIVSIPVGRGVPRTWGEHAPAVTGHYTRGSWDTNYDVARDGRFLVLKSALAPPPNEVAVWVNWFEHLKQLVPVE